MQSNRFRVRWRLRTAAVLTVPLVFASVLLGAQVRASENPGTADWRAYVVPERADPVTPASAAVQAAAETASTRLDERRDVWALNHYEDGSLVVNLTEGGMEAFGSSLSRLRTADTPVRLRQVEFGFDELMDRARLDDPDVWDREYGGAEIFTAKVDPELNRLVVGLSELDEDSIASARTVFGDDVMYELAVTPISDVGPDRWKDRHPYSGGAGYARNGNVGGLNGCTTAFATQRPSDGRPLMLTAGHCIGTVGIASYDQAASLNGGGTTWDNFLGTVAGYANSLSSTGASRVIDGERYGDLTVWRIDTGDPTIYWGTQRTTSYSRIRSTMTAPPLPTTSLCLSGGRSGTSCDWDVLNVDVAASFDGAVRYPLVYARNTTGGCRTGGDSGGAWIQGVAGGSRAAGVHTGGSRVDSTTCVAYFTSVREAAGLFGAVPLVDP